MLNCRVQYQKQTKHPNVKGASLAVSPSSSTQPIFVATFQNLFLIFAFLNHHVIQPNAEVIKLFFAISGLHNKHITIVKDASRVVSE